MATKARDRAPNFSTREIKLLVDLAVKHKEVLESRRNDAITWRDKLDTWNSIEVEFNAQHGVSPRTQKILKSKYEVLKKMTKRKVFAIEKGEIQQAGINHEGLELTETEEKIKTLLLLSDYYSSMLKSETAVSGSLDEDSQVALNPIVLLEESADPINFTDETKPKPAVVYEKRCESVKKLKDGDKKGGASKAIEIIINGDENWRSWSPLLQKASKSTLPLRQHDEDSDSPSPKRRKPRLPVSNKSEDLADIKIELANVQLQICEQELRIKREEGESRLRREVEKHQLEMRLLREKHELDVERLKLDIEIRKQELTKLILTSKSKI